MTSPPSETRLPRRMECAVAKAHSSFRGLFFKAVLDLEVKLIFIVNIDDHDEVKLNLGLNFIVEN